MNISDAAHEILERYWSDNREGGLPWCMPASSDPAVAGELVKGGYASLKTSGSTLELTVKGWDEARCCVRRHRLAERLMADVLDIRNGALHEAGCRLEHVLNRDVEQNICTLLGHPTACPHGKPIPPGPCCAAGRELPRKLVLPLSECEPGDIGKIAYVQSRDADAMDKLTAMGILPGLTVKLLRKAPSCLFQLGESQFAIDKKLGGRIYVRLCNCSGSQ